MTVQSTTQSPSVSQILGASNSPTASQATSGSTSSNQLSEQSFMQLMVSELENQDPTQPMNAQQMLAQLAQISTVSGINSLQSTVTNLTKSLQTNQALQASGLVGKNVLAPATQVTTQKAGSVVQGAVNLPSAAQNVAVGIYEPNGLLVNQINLGANSAGMVNFSWNGQNANGQSMPAGAYEIKAMAAMGGKAQSVSTYLQAPVQSVTLPKSGSSSITLGLGQGLGNIDLSNVTQIS